MLRLCHERREDERGPIRVSAGGNFGCNGNSRARTSRVAGAGVVTGVSRTPELQTPMRGLYAPRVSGRLRHLLFAILFAFSLVASHAAEALAWSSAELSGSEHPSLELHLAVADAALPSSRPKLPTQLSWLRWPSCDRELEPNPSDHVRSDALETSRRARPRPSFTRRRIPRMRAGDDRPPRALLND